MFDLAERNATRRLSSSVGIVVAGSDPVRAIRSGDTAGLRPGSAEDLVPSATAARRRTGARRDRCGLHAPVDRRFHRSAGPEEARRTLSGSTGRYAGVFGFQRCSAMIDVQQLHKAFGDKIAVADVSFSA